MFRVGDKVWNLDWGWGEVVEITHCILPVDVIFGDGYVESFTIDGKKHNTAINVALFFEEIPIPKSALKRPRWRADCGGRYHYIKATGDIGEYSDDRDCGDNSLYELGNYFKTVEEAKESKIYKVFHEVE